MKGALRHGIKILTASVLFLASQAHAQSQQIQLPAGGTSYASASGLFTVWNTAGEYSANAPVIYALQFGPTTYFYYKVGDTARWGTFTFLELRQWRVFRNFHGGLANPVRCWNLDNAFSSSDFWHAHLEPELIMKAGQLAQTNEGKGE